MAENMKLGIKVEVDNSQSKQATEEISVSIKELNAQLAQATKNADDMAAKFGAGSKEAQEAQQKVTSLSKQVADAQEKQNQKIDSAARSITALSAAYGGVQGALELTGLAGEDTIKQLAKIQSALAIGDAVQNLAEFRKDIVATFNTMKEGAVKGFNAIKGAIGATGIGAILLAVGALVTYWDDIKGAVNGVSDAQKKANEEAKKNVETQKEKLKAIDDQSNILKLQGKSEREILMMKIQQIDAAIKAAEVNVANQKQARDAQVEAAKRNKEFLEGLIKFVTFPITIALSGIDMLTAKLKDWGVISEETYKKVGGLADKFSGSVANLVFDPEETKKEGDKTVKEAEDALNQLKNQQAGFKLQLQEMNKKDAEKAAADRKKAAEDAAKAAEIQNEAIKSLLSEDAKARLEIENTYQQKRKQLADLGVTDYTKIEAEKNAALKALDEKAAADRLAFQEETDKMVQQNAINAMEDGMAKKQVLLEQEYQGQIDNFLKLDDARKARYAKDTEDLKTQLDNKQISEEEYNKRLKGINDARIIEDELYAKRRTAIDDAYKQKRADISQEILVNDQKTRNEALTTLLTDEDAKLEVKKAALDKELEYLQQFKDNKDLLTGGLGELEAIINNENVKLEIRKDALDKEEALLNDSNAKKTLGEEQYNKRVKAASDARTKIDKIEKEQRQKNAKEVGDALGKLSELIGKQTAAGKALAIGQATINTYMGATEALKQPSTLPSPFDAVAKAINVATIIASGIKSVKEIIKTPVPGGGGGGAEPAAISMNAPMGPQLGSTAIPQEQIDQLASANATTRAYVVESDVTNNQERITRLNRAARIN